MLGFLGNAFNTVFGLGSTGIGSSGFGAGAANAAAPAMRAGWGGLGGLGIAEGVMDWGNVFFNSPTAPAPTTPSGVNMYERAPELPGGGAMDEMGFRHWWLQTPTREAGMGPAGGGVPGDRFELPGMTTINDHTGQSTRDNVHGRSVPGVDANRLDQLLTSGRETGPWIPFLNDCNTTVDDMLRDAGGDRRNWDPLSPLHSRGLHDVFAGRAGAGDTGLTAALGLGGAGAAMACPAITPWLAGAGLSGYLSGTASSYFEAQGNTTAAEATSILGMGATGAMLGAGVGSIVPGIGTAIGAGVGGGAGLVTGSALSLFGDENPNSARVNVPFIGTSLSAEEGVGIGGMAAGGAALGATIGSIVPGLGTLIGAGVGGGLGALAGGISALWD